MRAAARIASLERGDRFGYMRAIDARVGIDEK